MLRNRISKLMAVAIVAMVAMMGAGQVQAIVVDPGNSLIPVGLGAGDSFQLAFVTSTRTNRDSGGGADNHGIGFWDGYVNTSASGSTLAGISGLNWKAMVSVKGNGDARDHAVVSGPVYRTDGALLANDFADMWDGTIANNLSLDESGNAVSTGSQGHLVWTGDVSNYSSPGLTGGYELGDGTDAAQVGVLNNAAWHSYGAHFRRGPTSTARVYALSEVIQIEAASSVPEPATATLALLGLSGLMMRRRRNA
jgi:hypothetical protein